jgi:hypothetical protein
MRLYVYRRLFPTKAEAPQRIFTGRGIIREDQPAVRSERNAFSTACV